MTTTPQDLWKKLQQVENQLNQYRHDRDQKRALILGAALPSNSTGSLNTNQAEPSPTLSRINSDPENVSNLPFKRRPIAPAAPTSSADGPDSRSKPTYCASNLSKEKKNRNPKPKNAAPSFGPEMFTTRIGSASRPTDPSRTGLVNPKKRPTPPEPSENFALFSAMQRVPPINPAVAASIRDKICVGTSNQNPSAPPIDAGSRSLSNQAEMPLNDATAAAANFFNILRDASQFLSDVVAPSSDNLPARDFESVLDEMNSIWKGESPVFDTMPFLVEPDLGDAHDGTQSALPPPPLFVEMHQQLLPANHIDLQHDAMQVDTNNDDDEGDSSERDRRSASSISSDTIVESSPTPPTENLTSDKPVIDSKVPAPKANPPRKRQRRPSASRARNSGRKPQSPLQHASQTESPKILYHLRSSSDSAVRKIYRPAAVLIAEKDAPLPAVLSPVSNEGEEETKKVNLSDASYEPPGAAEHKDDDEDEIEIVMIEDPTPLSAEPTIVPPAAPEPAPQINGSAPNILSPEVEPSPQINDSPDAAPPACRHIILTVTAEPAPQIDRPLARFVWKKAGAAAATPKPEPDVFVEKEVQQKHPKPRGRPRREPGSSGTTAPAPAVPLSCMICDSPQIAVCCNRCHAVICPKCSGIPSSRHMRSNSPQKIDQCPVCANNPFGMTTKRLRSIYNNTAPLTAAERTRLKQVLSAIDVWNLNDFKGIGLWNRILSHFPNKPPNVIFTSAKELMSKSCIVCENSLADSYYFTNGCCASGFLCCDCIGDVTNPRVVDSKDKQLLINCPICVATDRIGSRPDISEKSRLGTPSSSQCTRVMKTIRSYMPSQHPAARIQLLASLLSDPDLANLSGATLVKLMKPKVPNSIPATVAPTDSDSPSEIHAAAAIATIARAPPCPTRRAKKLVPASPSISPLTHLSRLLEEEGSELLILAHATAERARTPQVAGQHAHEEPNHFTAIKFKNYINTWIAHDNLVSWVKPDMYINGVDLVFDNPSGLEAALRKRLAEQTLTSQLIVLPCIDYNNHRSEICGLVLIESSSERLAGAVVTGPDCSDSSEARMQQFADILLNICRGEYSNAVISLETTRCLPSSANVNSFAAVFDALVEIATSSASLVNMLPLSVKSIPYALYSDLSEAQLLARVLERESAALAEMASWADGIRL